MSKGTREGGVNLEGATVHGNVALGDMIQVFVDGGGVNISGGDWGEVAGRFKIDIGIGRGGVGSRADAVLDSALRNSVTLSNDLNRASAYAGVALELLRGQARFKDEATLRIFNSQAGLYYTDNIGPGVFLPSMLKNMAVDESRKNYQKFLERFGRYSEDVTADRVSRPVAVNLLARVCVLYGMFAPRLPEEGEGLFKLILVLVDQCINLGAMEKLV